MEKIFTLAELEKDDSFIQYCLGRNAAAQAWWEGYVAAYPAQVATVAAARARVQALHGMLEEVYSEAATEQFRQLLLQRHGLPPEAAAPVMAPVNRRSITGKRVLRLAAAAVLLLLLAAGGILLLRNRKTAKAPLVQQLETRYGTRHKQVLPDGTVVWLNAGSRLRYSFREATLEGEAFFDVAKNEDHPFLVRAGGIVVRVLGTTFNIKAYHTDNKIEATLISGKISVQLGDDPEKQVLLSPNEKLVVQRSRDTAVAASLPGKLKYQVQALARPDSSDYYPETAWVENKLVFTNETFEEVAGKLERWYDVRIRFENERLKQEELSGTFDEENVQQALQLLQMTTRFRFREEAKGIVIY